MKNIKVIRNERGLSRSDLDSKYGIAVRTLEDWKTERRKCPSYRISF